MPSLSLQDLEKLVNLHKGVEIPDTTLTFDVANEYDNEGRYYTTLVPKYSAIRSWPALAKIAELHSQLSDQSTSLSADFEAGIPLVYGLHRQDARNISVGFDGLQSAPNYFIRHVQVFQIAQPPLERIVDGTTYRSIWNRRDLTTCVPHTDVTYKYLDKGMYFARYIPKDGKKVKMVFFKELTLEVFLIMHLLSRLNGHNLKVLQDECFIPAKNVRLLVLALEKQLAALEPDQFEPGAMSPAGDYIRHKNAMNKQFLGSAEQRVLNEFLQSKLPTMDKWDIKFTKTGAKYEELTVQHPDLLKIISDYGYVSWTKQFDIYDLAAAVCNYIRRIIKNGEGYAFSINGMALTISKNQYRLHVNDYTINKDEIEEVIRRALCYTDVAEFEKLVSSISKMSLLNHDALGNGLVMAWRKLPADCNQQTQSSFYQRDKMDKWKNMPRLRFKRVGGKIGLVTDVESKEHVEIRCFTGFVRSMKNLFNTINFGYTTASGAYTCKDYKYAERCIINLLRKHVSTAPTRTKNEDGTWTKTDAVPLITEEEARNILHAADTVTEKAVARAKEFLATIVTRVGAEAATVGGAKGYKVKGKKHTYFVNEETNQVSSFETGHSICIVDAGHQVRLGHDELATRLMALKHDEKTMSKIGTLSSYVR